MPRSGGARPAGQAVFASVAHEHADRARIDVDTLAHDRAELAVLFAAELHLHHPTLSILDFHFHQRADHANVGHIRPEAATLVGPGDLEYVGPGITGGITRLVMGMIGKGHRDRTEHRFAALDTAMEDVY